jgi:flagellar motor switch protein FliM
MPTLNPDEVNALMNAIEEGRVAEQKTAAAPGPVTVWDFNSHDRIIRGQLPTLDAINEQIASLLSLGLSGRTRLNLTVASRPATLQKFSDLANMLAPPSVLCVVRLGKGQGPGLCVFEPGTTEALLAAALGDRKPKSAELRPQPRVGLTSVEQMVMRRLTSVLTDALRTAWQEILPLQPEILRFETDPRMASVMGPNDVGIACSFELGGAIEGRVNLIIPYAAVEPIKAALLSPPRMSTGGDQLFAEALASELSRVEVEVRGVLGETGMRFEELLELEVGDLISLDADERALLPIYVQGRRKLAGSPCVAAGSLALRIEQDLATTHFAEFAPSPVH